MKSGITGIESDTKALMASVPGMSAQQRSYVLHYLSGKSKPEAALAAGYLVASASQVHRSVAVQAALAMAMERYLLGELAPLAMHTITRLLEDDKTAAGIKSQLALGVLDRAGYSAKRREQTPQGKEASQMTRDELQAEIDRLAREIDNRMVDVSPDNRPVSEPITAQELDMYE